MEQVAIGVHVVPAGFVLYALHRPPPLSQAPSSLTWRQSCIHQTGAATYCITLASFWVHLRAAGFPSIALG